MKNILLMGLLLLGVAACQSPKKEATFTEKDLTIIPKPLSVKMGEGCFVFNDETRFVVRDTTAFLLPLYLLAEELQLMSARTKKERAKRNYMELSLDKTLPAGGYRLSSDRDKVLIKASDVEGIRSGLQTLRQLFPPEVEHKIKGREWVIPAVTIEDAPAHQWRGLMLDVARHFFPKEYILKTLDRMALLKLNVLHLHLVDNEGWRIEIKKYPKLTEVGAWRVDQEDKLWDERVPNDADAIAKGAKKYGGYYSQEDIDEMVRYASSRGITIVPEIEMPAHVMSAIAAYPELSCHKRPIGVPSGAVWPITDIYCAGQEETFEFIEGVLTEVMELFPSKYIHIGGDEATHTEWEHCPKCQQRMKEYHLKDVHQLQRYFINRVNDFLVSKGRTLVGWDEIVEEGLAKDAVVMNWRGIEVGKQALAQGNKLVLTSDCYINHYQGLPDYEPLANGGYLPLKQLYHYNLEKDKLSAQEQAGVLGVQANLWAEHVETTSHSEYMIFPRLLALSEIAWTDSKLKNWEDFMGRVERFMPRMDAMGINYSRSMYQVVPTVKNKDGKVYLHLDCEVPTAEIKYALGGVPINKGQRYTAPIAIEGTTTYNAAVMQGNFSTTITTGEITFHKAMNKEVHYKVPYHKKYGGQGAGTLTNIVRGTKDFHDGQWLGWLGDDVEMTIDLGAATTVSEVRVGAMDAQSSGIYFPVKIVVEISADGKCYEEVAAKEVPCEIRGKASLKDFVLKFAAKESRYVRVKLKNVKTPPKGGDAWLFIDEVLVL